METCCQFLLCLCQVEGGTVDLCRRGNDKYDESNKGRNMAFEYPPAVCLDHHNVGHAEAACEHNDSNNAKPYRQHVTHYLRSAAHSTQQGVFIMTGPACH